MTPQPIARNAQVETVLLPRLANRHGLITGATGTGKTVSLQVLAERFSALGVPVFVSDVKGDLAGLSQAGVASTGLADRLRRLGLPTPEFQGFPVTLWDVYGVRGHPLRATVSDVGPFLLGRMLGLNDTQNGVLQVVFKVADDNRLLLLDMKDLRAMLQFVGDNAKDLRTKYGNVSPASVGAIQRGLLALETQGAEQFFGEPMLDLDDMMQTDATGRGVINILASERLLNTPAIYATFLLWLLSELFERMPEVGDPDKPRFVFFFDEAHLLFDNAPRALIEKVEQVVRLIRSKGVGVYFVTQSPLDVPDNILGQLGNRIQHALRAFTPRDQKAVRTAAATMRQNPAFSAETAITELAVGEALVSLLDEKGRPGIVERVWMMPPASRMGPITDDERAALLANSVVAGVYDQPVDRESAYEVLRARTEAQAAATQQEQAPQDGGGLLGSLGELLGAGTPATGGARGRARRTDTIMETAAKSATRTMVNTLSREIIRGVLGSIFKGRG